MKIKCRRCKKDKGIALFYRKKPRKPQRQTICKQCTTEERRINYAKNQKHYVQYHAEYRKQSKWKEYQNEYYRKNKERIIERNKKDPSYLQRLNVQWHKRKARLKGNGGYHSVREWEEVKEKYGYRCAHCGRRQHEVHLTKDHIIPISKGGTNSISNIQPLCLPCNIKKGTSIPPPPKQ